MFLADKADTQRGFESAFGGPLRLDGLRWIAEALKAKNPSNH